MRVFGALRLISIVQGEVGLAIVNDRWLQERKTLKDAHQIDPKEGQDRTTGMLRAVSMYRRNEGYALSHLLDGHELLVTNEYTKMSLFLIST